MNLANIPIEMHALRNWCVWRLEKIGGRETKIPYNARTGEKAKSNDRATWCSFSEAVRAVNGSTTYKGVGFMLNDSPYVCVDLDHCLDGGEKEAWARGIVDRLGGYVEVSQSGKGLHIFGRASVEHDRRTGGIEIYGNNRYIAMTGDIWEGRGALSDIQSGINALMAEHFATSGEKAGTYSKMSKIPAKPPQGEGTQQGAAPQSGADHQHSSRVDEVIARMHRENKASFADLFDRGDTSNYKSSSEADMALMNMIAFAADGDAALMEEVFSASALGRREKWKTRPDYRKMTVGTARVGWRENRLAFLPLTDTDNAERLRLLYGDDLKYLLERGTGKGATWARWDGKRWERIHEIGLYDLVAETACLSLAAVEKYLFHVEDDRIRKGAKERINYLMKLKNYGKMDACLKIARNFFQASVNDFDAEPFILNVQNGIVDLKTGVLYPHDRAAMCTRITRAEYRPELIGKESLWARTVAQIIPDEEERAYLQKWAGYLLTGSTREEKFLFLYGRGGSGKGTFINTIARMLGDYADTVDIEVFLSSRNDGHGGGANASPEIAKLAGIRTATANETPIGRRMNEAKIKTMTGRDDITARFLYGQQFTFSPAVKFVLSSNYVPAVHDASDEGIRRRLVIAPFMQDYGEDRDDTLKDRLHTKDEFAACLAWCVDGCLKWQKEGLGKPPRRFLQQMGMFYADSDTLQQFIDEMCITGEGSGKPLRVPVKQMLRAYADWSGDEIKRATMVNLMRRKGYDVHAYDVGQCFLKIALKGWFH